jgi:hypothetical protein
MISLTLCLIEQNETIGATKTKNWVIEEKPKPEKSQIIGYRRKKGISERGKPYMLNIALLKGGGSQVTSVWRKKEDPKAQRIARKFHAQEKKFMRS